MQRIQKAKPYDRISLPNAQRLHCQWDYKVLIVPPPLPPSSGANSFRLGLLSNSKVGQLLSAEHPRSAGPPFTGQSSDV